ncbi:MAG: lantibiotic dehydratase family protein [Bacteroidota bacterium]
MNNKTIPYVSFGYFVLRTPLFPFQFYENLTSGTVVDDITLQATFSNMLIQEAIFLASPTLYFEIEKWIKGELDKKKETKLKLSLVKYLTRMSSRCTPFGLFAGCTLGKFGDQTNLFLKEPIQFARYTRPDMNYLVALSQDLSKLDHVKRQLTFFPNSSIYEVGRQLRYIEYYYVNNRRQHHIVEIDNSPYLKKILRATSQGASLPELVNVLTDDTITENDAMGFLDELVESQVLVSTLEPSVSGPSFIDQILSVLKNFEECEHEIKFLTTLATKFKALDKKLGNAPKDYLRLKGHLKKRPTAFELKYLFQTDLELGTEACELDEAYCVQIKKALILFNRITPTNSKTNLKKFAEAFTERYEEREMPLCQVLDVETGIGYLQNSDSGDFNPLVDDLMLPEQLNPFATSKIELNVVYRILLQKLLFAKERNERVIKIEERDFKDLPLNWDDLPDTISSLIELVKDHDTIKIKLSSFNGSSAANLLGRFSHEGSPITAYTQNIVQTEDLQQPDKILAEIVHLPEARVGNILMRPSFRDYEIPYLAQSNLPKAQQIPLDDLCLSVRNSKVRLRSRKHGKEVVPHLTNAHNFSANALPIYQFLCDLQTQGLRGSIGFSFGPLNTMFDFLPRAEYGDFILQQAKWRIKKEEIQHLLKIKNEVDKLQSEMKQLQEKCALPQYVMLSDGDNELLINFNNTTSLQMLLETVKNREEFILTEYLHHLDSPVKSRSGHYANQVVISYYNQNKLNKESNTQMEFHGEA